MARKLTRDDIIDRFRLVHGDKYDYSKFEYINAITKGVFILTRLKFKTLFTIIKCT